MQQRQLVTIDGNEAAASVAYRASEVIAIYPITPSSPMGELADQWAAEKRPNLWGAVPDVVEMQSEGGAAGAVHGALQAGALATTFTASQGLLLMVPNLYKIAGELTSFCLHVAARTLATHALSIFGDHSDVMACRPCGLALLASNNVQEAHDLALVGHAATLRARLPFLHFFDGFRTSHEVAKIEALGDDDLRALLPEDLVRAHRERGLTPDKPVVRGTAQNPDAFFQAREACNAYYEACPQIVQQVMDQLGERTGRRYRLFDYHGHPLAETVVVAMGSGVDTLRAAADWWNGNGSGGKVGVLAVRLYRPFAVAAFLDALPKSVKNVVVLDRTKEPGAIGEPLFQDVLSALAESGRPMPRLLGGRYGLSSKEFTPAMAVAVFEEAKRDAPKRRFTVGIRDDVTHLSLDWDRSLDVEPGDVVRAVFWGLGSDGTVSANKNSIKIIGEETEQHAQGYFVYDSKKAGAITVSHLRFGERPIRSPWLIQQASFVACHNFGFLDRYDVLEVAAQGAVFLLNAPYPTGEVWDRLPREVQETILGKELRCYVIDAQQVAREAGLGGRINTIMQTCFFAISGVLPRDAAIAQIKKAVDKTYGKLGGEVVRRNYAAVDAALAHLHELAVPAAVSATRARPPVIAGEAPDFVGKVTALMLAGKGDLLPVSAFPIDGTWPVGTSRYEKRGIAQDIPIWDPKICIQCNQCAFVCPHAAIRAKTFEPQQLAGAPEHFLAQDCRVPEFKGGKYTIQVAPDDCTGCWLCVEVCPAKDKSNPKHKAIDMEPRLEVLERERQRFDFFLALPEVDRTRLARWDARGVQFLEPLFEFSGACAGCGETPYIKLLTQLFGDRLLIANATGCSSIYGGNLPTTPYCTDQNGRGPAWSNSLFEDNAEFGLGLRLAADSHERQAKELLRRASALAGDNLVRALLEGEQRSEKGIAEARARVRELRQKLAGSQDPTVRELDRLADWLVRKSVWLVGGDGWAYDIGYGGLDHVLSLGRDVNVLVLDTEVYSNTGGQQSKATPLGAAAKFAVAGKESAKKDLGLEAMSYENVYVARVAFGAKVNQTVQSFVEAEAYPGTSLILAYSHCVAHGYDLRYGAQQQKLMVDSAVWPLYRFDPRRTEQGEPGLQLDSGKPTQGVKAYMQNEARFRMIEKSDPKRFKMLLAAAQKEATRRWSLHEQLAGVRLPKIEAETEGRQSGKEE